MYKLSFVKRKLFLLLYYIAIAFFNINTITASVQLSDSALIRIMQYPETISLYSTEELMRNVDKDRIRQMSKIIISLNANGISRSIIKQHYFPLCRNIIKSYFHKSEILQKMALNRDFTLVKMIHTDSISTNRNIISRFIEYQHICMAIMDLPFDDLPTPFIYGDMRMIESFIWDENQYMDRIDPIPNKLITNINNLFNIKIQSLEKDLCRLLQVRSHDTSFLIDNAALLLEASTYLSQYQIGIASGIIYTAYISQGQKQKLIDLINLTYSKRWGLEFWNKLKPIITYRITGVLEVEKIKTFKLYRDSLLSKKIEFAKYYPHQCPDDMKYSEVYKEYNNKFYDAIDYIFSTIISNTFLSQYSVDSQFFNIIGCKNQTEFLRLYIMETLKRYYNDNDFLVWNKIESIREYLERSSKYPVDLALDIVECYAPINALKARDLIRHTSLISWLDEQMINSQQNAHELGLRAASVVAYVYASLYNKSRYPDILKYMQWVEKNIERVKVNKDNVIYNIASTLSLMEKYKESNIWISKVEIDKSEYKQEFYRLLLVNHCKLENTKETIKIASKISSFSYQDILRLLIANLKGSPQKGIEELLSTFTSSLSYDFNLFSYMDSDDQDWSSRSAKYITTDLLIDIDLLLWIKKELNKKDSVLFEQYYAVILYNWALASKGALLRSNKFMRELILNKMSSEQYHYFQHALDFDEDDYKEDNLDRRLDSYISEQAKKILLDYVRKDTTNVLPQFDYNIVRNQLQKGDIAIELVKFDKNMFNAVMIRKEWKYPKYVTFSRDDKEDNSQRLWSYLVPYLKNIQRIYISLDGEYNFENVELAIDSSGVCFSDKYNIYRVSTTLNIPKDVYLSDIKMSVLYGNLKYADSDENLENMVSIEKINRGAITEKWIQLDETEKELDVISKILTNSNIPYKKFEGENGSKASFMDLNKQKVDLLHIATHGFYNDEYVSIQDGISAMKRSGIVLSNSTYDLSYSKQSGSIFANEIANMDLNSVKLLLLSACETAQGFIGDDGVFGLQRGFKQAGVGCIIMTLKEVNNIMSTELIQLFYSFFAKGQSARNAFRNAQKQIALKYKINDWKYFIIID